MIDQRLRDIPGALDLELKASRIAKDMMKYRLNGTHPDPNTYNRLEQRLNEIRREFHKLYNVKEKHQSLEEQLAEHGR